MPVKVTVCYSHIMSMYLKCISAGFSSFEDDQSMVLILSEGLGLG
jgi:hypothetical protein